MMKIKFKLTTLLTSLLLISNLIAQDATLEWVNQSGGTAWDVGNSITTDYDGNVIVAGEFGGTVDFDPGIGVNNLVSHGQQDIFVQKLDSDGNLLWVGQMGGTGFDACLSIKTDELGNMYLTGNFSGTVDFDPNEETTELTSNGSADIFVQKLDPSGNLLWVNQMGGTGANDTGNSIALDSNGDIIIAGYFESTVDFDPSSEIMDLTSNGNIDIFIQKLDADGNLLWVNQIGGPSMEIAPSVTTDPSGNVYTCGTFSSIVDFDPSSEIELLSSNGTGDMFIQKLDSDGNLLWVKQMGSYGGDSPLSIAIDNSGDVCVTGVFMNTVDFDPGSNVFNLTSNGLTDIFIQKLKTNGDFSWAKQMGGTEFDFGHSIAIDEFNNILVAGFFEDEIDIDPNAGVLNFTSNGQSDIFIQKLSVSGDLLWAKHVGGTLDDRANSIGIDNGNNIYTTGQLMGVADFDPDEDETLLTSNGNRDVFIQKLNQNPVGITENTFEEYVQAYPNPTNGNFAISFESIQEELNLKIMSITGQLIRSQTFQNITQYQMELDESAGVYFIEMTNEDGKQVVLRLVKE